MIQVTAERPQTRRWNRLFALLLIALTALIACYCISLFVYTPRNNDQSSFLYDAQRVIAGVHLYGPELVESNPPLIIWFSVIPVLLGRLLHLDAYLMLRVVVFLMVIGSVAWCARIICVTGIAQSRARLFIGIASVLSAEIFMTGYVVGQREHLLVILILPYLLCAIADARTKLCFAELCAVGLMGGIAVCFKPQQVLIFIGLELFLALYMSSLRRLLSPDFLCAILAIFLYIGLVSITVPRYFTATIPLVREEYWGIGLYSAWDLIVRGPVFDVLFILTALILILRWKKLRLPIVPGAFLACSLAAAIAFYVQHTGAEYRAYPQEASLLLAMFWIAMELVPGEVLTNWKPNSTFVAGALIVFLLLLLPSLAIGRALQRFDPPHWRIPGDVFAQYPPGTPVLLLSTALDAFPAVEDRHLLWSSRYDELWMLPAIIRSEAFEAEGPRPKRVLPPAIVKRLAAQIRTETAEDIHRWEPAVVIVQQCHKSQPCWALGNIDFDTLSWFLQSPAFAAEWTHYRFQARQKNYDVYTRFTSTTPDTAPSRSRR